MRAIFLCSEKGKHTMNDKTNDYNKGMIHEEAHETR